MVAKKKKEKMYAGYKPEGETIEEEDKKGKGSGTKDACYKKVKASAKVWPSAYASGRLVQCRKKGAANYGNSKKEGYEYADEGLVDGVKNIFNKLKNKIKQNSDARKNYKITNPGGNITKDQYMQQIRNAGGDPSHQESKSYADFMAEGKGRLTSSNDMQSKMYADKNKSGKKMSDDEIKKEKGGKEFLDRIKVAKEKMNKEEVLDEIAMKKDKKVPLGRKSNPYGKRAVAKMIIKSLSEPARAKAGITKEQTTVTNDGSPLSPRHSAGGDLSQFNSDGTKKVLKKTLNKIRGTAFKTEGTSYGMYKGDGKPKGPMAKFGKKKKKEKKIEEKVNLKDKSSQYARSTKEVDTAMTDHVNRKRGTHYGKDGKVTEVGRYRRQSKREARNELISMNKESKTYSQFQQECWKTHKKVGMKMKGGKLVPDCRPKNEEVEIIDEKKSPAWQRKAGKSESGGLNAKGVASYRAANPGSKLKTAVTTKPSKLKKGSKSANRRKSFCARMTGMKKRLTSAKTARDPDSRINKALRKWNC